jgi:hypothetical protein
MALVLRLLTRGWLRVMWPSPLADLVKETGLSVRAAKNQLRRLARTSRLPGLNITRPWR